MTFELRQAAMQCAIEPLREQLFDCANGLQVATKLFAISASQENLEIVNGLWARGDRLLKEYEQAPDGGNGGKMRQEKGFINWPPEEGSDEDNLLREAA
jgi:hypothetical protein